MVTALEGHIKPLVDCEDWRGRYCLLRGLACLIQGSSQVCELLDVSRGLAVLTMIVATGGV